MFGEVKILLVGKILWVFVVNVIGGLLVLLGESYRVEG